MELEIARQEINHCISDNKLLNNAQIQTEKIININKLNQTENRQNNTKQCMIQKVKLYKSKSVDNLDPNDNANKYNT